MAAPTEQTQPTKALARLQAGLYYLDRSADEYRAAGDLDTAAQIRMAADSLRSLLDG